MMEERERPAWGLVQPSFSFGEMDPKLFGRIDFEAYYKGLRSCRNMIPSRYGGIDNRPGTEVILPPNPTPLPDVYIEMKNVALWQPNFQDVSFLPSQYWPYNIAQPDPITPAEMQRTLDTRDFDGNPTYWWEVLGNNLGFINNGVYVPTTIPYTLSLVDTDGNEYASITFESETPGPSPPYDNWDILQRKRVQFTPPAGVTTFAVKINPRVMISISEYANNPILGAIRIIIKQDSSVTKSMIQIPMQCLGDYGVTDYYKNNNSLSADFQTGKEGSIDHLPNYDTVLTYANTIYRSVAGIWKYSSAELASISKALFEAVGGSPIQRVVGAGSQYFWYWTETGSPTPSWMIALFDSTETEVPNSRATGSLDQQLDFSAQLPLTSGTYHPKTSTDGGSTWRAFGTTLWTVNHTPIGGNITWSVVQNPWYVGLYGVNGVRFQFSWMYSSGNSLDSLYVALFDATTDTMVTGTELVWGPNSDVSRKQALFDPARLTDGHEYEIRWKVPDSGGIGAMIGYEANLYLWINPVTAFTVWQRVACGEYDEYLGTSPHDNNDESRVLLNLPSGASAFFENVAKIWDGYSPDDIPLLYQLVDAGATDFGRAGTVVSGSQLTWNGNETPETRIRKRSGLLSLTDGNRFITDEANQDDWLVQVQAFLVVQAK